MLPTHQSLRRAFTLIEVLVATTIVVIILSVSAVNLRSTQEKARNTNKQEAVREYHSAIELYKAVRGNYFIYSSKRGGGSCPTAVDTSIPTAYYRLYGLDSLSCTGYLTQNAHVGGGGQGRMTRTIPGIYSPTSISQALVDEGVIKDIRTYPGVTNFTQDTPDKKNDFILVLCRDDGQEPTTAAEATNFTVYAQLEGPANLQQQAEADQSCGGPGTSYGRYTIQ